MELTLRLSWHSRQACRPEKRWPLVLLVQQWQRQPVTVQRGGLTSLCKVECAMIQKSVCLVKSQTEDVHLAVDIYAPERDALG